uniref:KDEL endoplasmic reticulum protein retention receptor 1 n=1 Tax=Canis lupus familiaris TaxID=9615 RepID=A0A8I3MFZ0_CANLF
MNLFRFLGDLSHLLAIILLLLKIWKSRSCAGETPMGREKGGECGGHPTTRGRVWRHEGDGSPRPSPPLLTGDPPSRSGVTGGSVPFRRLGVYTVWWGVAPGTQFSSPWPFAGGPGISGLGAGSRGRQGGGWELVTWTVAAGTGAGERRPVPGGRGISGKSQVLFAVVFTARYLDLFTNYISLYNTCMKVVYIACSFTTVWMIYSKFKATYDGNHDTFRVEFLVVPTAILAFLVNHDFTPLEILWTFSIYLESVAILPQLFMVSKTGEAETITSHYLFALGVYRTLYLFNWIWRYHFEGFFDLIAIVAGLVQTVLYCDFFYLYITKVLKGKKLSLPA